MKIVCEACQAKYSISDDKVRGKVFKIRCKKCSHVIVVRGTDDAPVTAAAAEAPAADAPWHVVVDGEQVGPLADSEIRGRVTRGELSADTFIWKEGMSDWVKLSTLPEFAGGASNTPAVTSYDPVDVFAAPAATGSHAAPVAAHGAGADEGLAVPPRNSAQADPFAALGGGGSASSGAPDLFGAPVGAQAGAGLGSEPRLSAVSSRAFTPVESQSAIGDAGGGRASNGAGHGQGSPYVGNLTGQRHENSVLFSLSNLEALAKPGPGPAAASPSSAARPAPTSEGSGLIDIRAMAAMTLNKGGGDAYGSSSGGQDLPAFGAPQFSPVAPVLLPMSSSSGTPKWVWGLLAGVVVLLGAGALAIYKVMSTPPAAPPPVVQAPPPAAAPTAPAGAIATAPAPTAPAAGAAPTTPPETPPPSTEERLPPREAPRAEPARASKAAGGREAKRGGDKGGKRESGSAKATAAAVPAAREERKPEPAEKPAARGGDELDALLGRALSGGGNKAAAPAPKPKIEDEPKQEKSLGTLSRDDIVKGMNGVLPRARDCFKQFKVPGQVDVTVTVAKAGRVSDVEITGKFAGTPSGSCVADAVRGAKFAPNDGTKIPKYPVFLR